MYGNIGMHTHLLHTQALSTGHRTGSAQSGQAQALHQGLDLSLNAGELMLLVGRNGIGKSVLLRTLAGIHPPLTGTIHIKGQNIAELDEPRRAACVSMVLATPPQELRLTVMEVVLSGRFRFAKGLIPYRSADREAAQTMMDLIGINGWENRTFQSLSDGEKQKVMLARCWAQDTPLILLDEPLAFLDYPSRKEFLGQLNRLCQHSGKAAIYSSHDLSLSLLHCHKVLHLKTGSYSVYQDPSALSGDQWMHD